jgi:hypothetical protein
MIMDIKISHETMPETKEIKCTPQNIRLLCKILLDECVEPDEWGAFDGDTDLLSACDTVIGWFKDEDGYRVDEDGNLSFVRPKPANMG